MFEKLPGVHSSRMPPLTQRLPAGQSAQGVVGASEYRPGAQSVHDVPSALVTEPVEHSWHVLSPRLLYIPEGQGKQLMLGEEE